MADPKKQYVVRTAPAPLADFDEQWWPVTLLLLISAGCLGGYVWLTSDFHSPNLLLNGWFHLGLIGILVIALISGVAMLRGSSQRRMQLGIFLSLSLHLGLLFFGRQVYMSIAERPQPTDEGVLDDADDVVVSIPDYLPQNDPSRATDPLTRPAETEIRNEPKTEMTAQTPAPVETKKEAVEEPQPVRDPQQSPREVAKVEVTVPRLNEILSGANLSRKELSDQLPTDVVPDRQINRASQPELAMNAPTVEADRQTPSDSPTRRPNAAETPQADRPKPDLSPFAPMRRPQEEQTASLNVQAQLNRPTSDAVLPELNAPAAGGAAPRVAADAPSSPQPVAVSTGALRQTSSAEPAGSPTQVVAPQMAFTSNVASSAEPQRAETSEPSPSAVASLAPRQPSRITGGAVDAGIQSVPLSAPAVTAATDSTTPGGATLEATATGVVRGNQGTPQLATGEGPSLPVPLGAGSGATVGGTTVGPRSDLIQGDGGAGVAAAATVVGRPGRGRAAGPASAPQAAVPSAAIAGVPGVNNIPGNATSGASASLQPSASDVGVVRGSNGSAGGIAGPAQPQSGTAVGGVRGSNGTVSGSATGIGGGATASIARVDDGNAAGSATAVGRSSTMKLSPGNASVALSGLGAIAVPTTSPAADSADRGTGENAPAVAAGAVGIRREAAGVSVMVNAPEGPGGLTARVSADVGLPSRRAQTDSEVAHLEINRLIPERLGGKISGGGGQVRDTAVVGFKQRDPGSRGEIARIRGGSQETESAVERGLAFLARHQSPDGSWSLHDWNAGHEYPDAAPGTIQSNAGATGLVLLTFLGAGYTHDQGKYREHIARGLDWLIAHQKPDGDLFIPQSARSTQNVWLYSHGGAAAALCEAYGMTRDERLREPAQRAIDFIAYAQDPVRGGWQYTPQRGSDTSVSEWQMMALKSGELAGLTVPADTLAKLTNWIDTSEEPGINPARVFTGDEAKRVPSRAIMAGAMLMRLHLNRRNDPKMAVGAEWLRTHLPTLETRETYYWYYGTQVMFQLGGRDWDAWNRALSPILVSSQERNGGLAGSWSPNEPVADRWSSEAGRLYSTCMHLLMLEVYYRYLPLEQIPQK